MAAPQAWFLAGRAGRGLDWIMTLAQAVAACALVLALVLTGLAVVGYSPVAIVTRWACGAAGGVYPLTSSMVEACPLLLTGLAAGLTFRAGVLNIGAQGQFLVGAVTAVGLTTRWLPAAAPLVAISLAIAAGALAGGLWALLASVLERYRAVPVVLSTILLNFVALYLIRALLHGPLQAAGTAAPQSPLIPARDWLGVLIPLSSFHWGVPAAFLVAVGFWWFNTHTTWGFETFAAGLNPAAANLAGIPVRARQFLIMFLGGGCAGLAGVFQVLGVTHFMTASFGDYGYAGIAVALLGRLNPLGIALAAIFFGLLDVGSQRVQESTLALPQGVADVVKALVILFMLLLGAYLARRHLQVTSLPEAAPPASAGAAGPPGSGN